MRISKRICERCSVEYTPTGMRQKYCAACGTNHGKYLWFRSRGVCPVCQKNPAEKGKAVCRACAENRKKYRQTPEQRHEEYEYFKARGLCPICRKAPAAPGHTQCARCLEKKARRWARSDKPRDRARARELYRRRKKAGVCVQCRCRPAAPGHVRCARCEAYVKAHNAAHRVSRTREPGECLRCGAPVQEGQKYCPEHYARMCRQAALMREKAGKPGPDHPWRGR